MSQELYKRYRPRKLKEVVGQEVAIRSLEKQVLSGKTPHAILLTGPSGVGKTTIARILKAHLGCADQDFFEKNCADFRSVDDIREIRRHLDLRPLAGRCRLWIIDECHKLTNDAQNAMLKMLEDTPKHVYFVLCTTDPQKLIKTILTRCSQIKLSGLSTDHLIRVMVAVRDKEGLEVSQDVLQEIASVCEGSARKALVILEQVGELESEKEQVEAIQTTSYNKDVTIDLARALINQQSQWGDISKLLRRLEDQEPEGIRYCVLAYARACLLGGSKIAPRAYMIIDIFAKNFYDSKHAGLAAACYEVMTQH